MFKIGGVSALDYRLLPTAYVAPIIRGKQVCQKLILFYDHTDLFVID